MHERNVGRSRLAIIKHSVTRAERAARTILPGKTDRNLVEQKGAEGERFRVMPFIGPAIFENLASMLEDDALDLGLDVKLLRHVRQAIHDLLQHFLAHGSGCTRTGVFRLENRRRFLEAGVTIGLVFLQIFDLLQRHLEAKL